MPAEVPVQLKIVSARDSEDGVHTVCGKGFDDGCTAVAMVGHEPAASTERSSAQTHSHAIGAGGDCVFGCEESRDLFLRKEIVLGARDSTKTRSPLLRKCLQLNLLPNDRRVAAQGQAITRLQRPSVPAAESSR